MILLKTTDGLSFSAGIARLLQAVKSKLDNSGKTIQQSLLWTVRQHFSQRYPGSTNFAPSKVQPDVGGSVGNAGSVVISTKGIGRAYHDVTIVPKTAKYLTVPITGFAQHHSARDFDDLFVITKKNGTKFLARKQGTSLQFLYVLCKKVFQKQDSSIMPTDQKLADNILARISARL